MTLNRDSISGLLRIEGALDIDGANSLREALLESLLQPEVTLDLSGVEGCDAAALQVLLAGRNDAASAGKAFRVLAASDTVTATAAALGFLIAVSGNRAVKDRSDAD